MCGLVSITLLLVALPERSASEDIRPVLSGVLPVATPVHTEFDGIEALPVLQDTPPGQTGDDTGAIAGTEPAAGEVGDVDAADAGPGVSGAGGSGGVAGIEALVCAYSWPCAEALSLAWCESRYDAAAVSPDGANYGLFQVNVIHRGRVGGDVRALLDPVTNVRVAYEIYRDAGYSWGPWSCKA